MRGGKAAVVSNMSLREMAWSRRAFLGAVGGALTGMTACSLPGSAHAASRHPQRGGTLRFATRSDATGLDPHRNTIYPVSMPLAAMSQGLLDLNCAPNQCRALPVVGGCSRSAHLYVQTAPRGAISQRACSGCGSSKMEFRTTQESADLVVPSLVRRWKTSKTLWC